MNAGPLWFQLLMIYMCVLSACTTGIQKWVSPMMPFWVPFLYFWAIGTTLYSVHVAGHSRRLWMRWYRAHVLGHHIENYPSSQFIQPTYQLNTKDPYWINPQLYIFSALLTSAVFCSVMRRFRFVSTNEELALMGITLLGAVIEERLHIQFHLADTWSCLNWRYVQPYWLYLRRIHQLHHTGKYDCNYAAVAIFFDRLYGTLVE